MLKAAASREEEGDMSCPELEADDDQILYRIREQRMREFREQQQRQQKDAQLDGGDGRYTVVGHERELMQMCVELPRIVIHFFRPNFRHCQQMAQHLTLLAERQGGTKFVGIDATQAPFLVVQWAVRVLPCVVCVVDGVAIDRLIGFDGVNGTEGTELDAARLQSWLLACKVLLPSSNSSS
jgi:thiol-disulfide isomerase/thioredoxin